MNKFYILLLILSIFLIVSFVLFNYKNKSNSHSSASQPVYITYDCDTTIASHNADLVYS